MAGRVPREPTAAPTWIAVNGMRAYRHEKQGYPVSMRVEYSCGIRTQREWIWLEHPPGYARDKAERWWRLMRGAMPVPTTVDEAIERFGELTQVDQIRLRPNGRYFEIIGTRLKTEVAA